MRGGCSVTRIWLIAPPESLATIVTSSSPSAAISSAISAAAPVGERSASACIASGWEPNGSSGRMQRYPPASAVAVSVQRRLLTPKPWTKTSGSPLPASCRWMRPEPSSTVRVLNPSPWVLMIVSSLMGGPLRAAVVSTNEYNLYLSYKQNVCQGDRRHRASDGPGERMSPAAGPRRTQAERREATRAALIAAGRKLFAERGYERVGTEEIVAAAGVTRGALYHHFDGKRGLFAAVFEDLE